MMSFEELSISELKVSPDAFGRDWMALAVGNGNSYNAMTIAWGNIGSLWDKYDTNRHEIFPTATVYVRPQRYTKEFMDRESLFTICWFGKNEGRHALAYLGSHSGRDEDKVRNAGLTPVFDRGTVYFQEAKLVIICRKLYHARLVEEGFVDRKIVEKNYPQRDFHEMYVGEIIKVLKQN